MTIWQNIQRITPEQRRFWGGLILVVILVIALFGPMAYHWRNIGDFEPHAIFTEQMLRGDTNFFVQVPNFLYHMVTAIWWFVLPVSIQTAGAVAALSFHVMLAIVIYIWLQMADATWRSTLMAIGLTLALMLVAPFNLFTPENLYFGYFMPYVYHNPTGMPLRPTAVLLFIAALKTYDVRFGHSGWAWLPLYATLTLLCILAKPSYLMILLPALALVTLWRMVQRQYINWVLLIGGIVLPAVGLLGYQALTYTEGGMQWEPLRTFFEWTLHYEEGADQQLALKLVLSVLFPLVVYGVYWRRAWHNLTLNLAWVSLGMGLLYAYLFIDVGEIAAGNLVWNAQIGVTVLFVASAWFWLQQIRLAPAKPDAQTMLYRRMAIAVCAAALGLHLIAGVYWYALHLGIPYLDLVYIYW